LGNKFQNNFILKKSKIIKILESLKKQNKKITIYGAGHFASMFMQIYGISSYFICVFDDDSNKHGLYMPGGQVIISNPDNIQNVDVIFLAINPLNEERVIEGNNLIDHAYIKLFSIFELSNLYYETIV